jgi:hypothetical protein
MHEQGVERVGDLDSAEHGSRVLAFVARWPNPEP